MGSHVPCELGMGGLIDRDSLHRAPNARICCPRSLNTGDHCAEGFADAAFDGILLRNRAQRSDASLVSMASTRMCTVAPCEASHDAGMSAFVASGSIGTG